MSRWVALLRGVNVGGANRLPMADLRASLTARGLADVATYVQSGNIAVTAGADHDERSIGSLVGLAIADDHGLSLPVVVRAADHLAEVAARHPDADGGIDPKLAHVVFLDRLPDAVADVPDPAAFAPDRWRLDGREVYVTYPNGSGRSKLTIDVFERAWGVTATARNLNTVRKLALL